VSHDTGPAPPAATETAAPQSPKRAWGKRLGLSLGLLLAATAGALTLRENGDAAPESAKVSSDTPRVQGDRITYSEGFEKRAGLRTTKVRHERLVPIIAAVGTIDYNAEHVAAVGTRLRGLVSRVSKFEGDAVTKGATLALVESAELGEAQATVSMLDAERHAAQLNAEREARLAERSLTTARELETAAVDAKRAALMLSAAQQKVRALSGSAAAPQSPSRLGAHDLRSPIAGTIVERNVAAGQFVDGGLVAFKVANLDHLWVELDVFERNLGHISVGDAAELRPLSGAGASITGRVAKIASKIDPVTHSARVRIAVENRDRRLRVGQAVQATIQASGGKSEVRAIVPTSAITFVDGKPTVFVVVGPRAVQVKSVELGAADSDETELLTPLPEGTEFVTEGAFALKSELFR
jgi:membrane fusion protein, heavy metal efflux system